MKNTPDTVEATPKSAQKQPKPKKRYPSDVEDDEWQFVLPYLSLIAPDSPQRKHELREVFNALRYVVRTGIAWRYLPDSFPPWEAVYQQAQRWIGAGVFEDIVDDLREVLRVAAGRNPQPSAAILDAQTVQGTIESGQRAGYDGHKKKNGTKVHIAVDTLGRLLALVITPANEQERDKAAKEEGIRLEVVRLPEVKKGFVLLPRRWVVERSFSWKNRFRRLARDYERLPETVAGLHFVAFACLMLQSLLGTTPWSS